MTTNPTGLAEEACQVTERVLREHPNPIETAASWITTLQVELRGAQARHEGEAAELAEGLRPFASNELIRRAEDETDEGRCRQGAACCVRYMTTLGSLYDARALVSAHDAKRAEGK